jgi:hypothetical protein
MARIRRGSFPRFTHSALAVSLLLLFSPRPAMGVYEWYSLSKSTRALGMGGAFYGLSDDESALFYNPAGLSTYKGGVDFMGSFRVEGSTSAASALSTIMDGRGQGVGQLAASLEEFQGKPIFANIAPAMPYYLRRGLAIGLLLADVKANATVTGSGVDTSVDVTAIVDSGLFIGFAGKLFSDKLHLGMTLKGLVRGGGRRNYSVLDIAAGDSLELDVDQIGGAGFGIDADIGAMYEVPEIIEGVKQYASVSINNLLATSFDLARITSGGVTAPQLPRMFTLSGRAEFPGVWKFDRFTTVLDFAEFSLGGQSDPNFGARHGSFWKHVNFGVEAPIGWFTLRTGFRQGNISAGFGIDARFFQLDFATYAEEVGANPGRISSRRVALRLAAGFGGAAPAVEPLRKSSEPPKIQTISVGEGVQKPSEPKMKTQPEKTGDTSAEPNVFEKGEKE